MAVDSAAATEDSYSSRPTPDRPLPQMHLQWEKCRNPLTGEVARVQYQELQSSHGMAVDPSLEVVAMGKMVADLVGARTQMTCPEVAQEAQHRPNYGL